jgi:hypothetical protein
VVLPEHGHDLTFGIFQGQTATSVEVYVDGALVASGVTSQSDFNIVPYLSKDGEGNIIRGWHTIKFVPNALTRIRCSVLVQEFISGRKLS